MAENPAIVIAAYNRPASLYRLLNSLAAAVYPNSNIQLVISIDKSDSEEVLKLAEHFDWKYGSKKIIARPENLGLKEHIICCGNLTEQYDSLILLEDDLLVSPYFYDYACKASDYYKNEEQVAGISLYNYQVAESCFYPFKAIDDGSDVYFMQVASSWGQLWTKRQWLDFKNWFAQHTELPADSKLPAYLFEWGKNSWKKHYIHYLITTQKYFVFPRLSLSTNFEDAGTNALTKNVFHVPLQLAERKYKFCLPHASKARYDAWFEMLPQCLNLHNPALSGYDYAVDLYGIKNIQQLESEYILTTKTASEAERSFSSELFPLETNIALNLKGKNIGLYKRANNTFANQKPALRNYLEDLNKEMDPGISIVIPLETFNASDFQTTIDSVAKQEYRVKECIIVSKVPNASDLEKILSGYNLRIKVISCETGFSLPQMLNLGFKCANFPILGWIRPGGRYSMASFEKVAGIFKAYHTINWIQGLPEDDNYTDGFNSVKTREYRLTAPEAYSRLLNGKLDFSLELHFFRKHSYEAIADEKLRPAELYFQFITHYEIRLVACKLAEGLSQASPGTLTAGELADLSGKYCFFKKKKSIKSLLINLLVKLPGINSETAQWLYPSLNNYPDVLRFDTVNNSFYLHKY